MDKHDWLYIGSGALYMGFEYWMGKTPKTKAGSLLEFLLLGLKAYNNKLKGEANGK